MNRWTYAVALAMPLALAGCWPGASPRDALAPAPVLAAAKPLKPAKPPKNTTTTTAPTTTTTPATTTTTRVTTTTTAPTTTTTTAPTFRPMQFSPYVPVWNFPDLSAESTRSGARRFTVAFVLGSAGTCRAAWDGSMTLDSAAAQDIARNIAAFQDGGGEVVASFGGSGGVDLSRACPDAASMAREVFAVIDAVRPAALDFDVEGASTGDATVNQRRADALALIQARYPTTPISVTLESATSGMTARQLDVLRPILAAHVWINGHVNLMTMYFGADPNRMGAQTISAGDAAAAQLRTLMAGLTVEQSRWMVSVTPLIGLNSFSGERFTLEDARAVKSWAVSTGIGGISMWNEMRDRACAGANTDPAQTCNGIATTDFAYSSILR